MSYQGIKIAHLKHDQDVWFIRSQDGMYTQHFRQAGLVAIGHLDLIYKADPSELPTEHQLRNALLQNESYSSFVSGKDGKSIKKVNKSGSRVLQHVLRFANDIKKGDLIVTKTEQESYMFGVCTSDAYIDSSAVELQVGDGEEAALGRREPLLYSLRREVAWGPFVRRSNFPIAVKKATSGSHTISKLTDYREMVFHLLYPFFTDGEMLYFSNKIRTEVDINSAVVGQLFQNIALARPLMEALASKQLNSNTDVRDFSFYLIRAMFASDKSATCKAEFTSPGDIWGKIPLDKAVPLGPQLLSLMFSCLVLTGHIPIDGFEAITSVSDIAINEFVAGIAQDVGDDVNPIFSDKFDLPKPADDVFDTALTVTENDAKLAELRKNLLVEDIKDTLDLALPQAQTGPLEENTFGIDVLMAGKKDADN